MSEGLQETLEVVGLKPHAASMVYDRFTYPWAEAVSLDKQPGQRCHINLATELVWQMMTDSPPQAEMPQEEALHGVCAGWIG